MSLQTGIPQQAANHDVQPGSRATAFVERVGAPLSEALAKLARFEQPDALYEAVAKIFYTSLRAFAPYAPSKQKKAFRDALTAMVSRVAEREYDGDEERYAEVRSRLETIVAETIDAEFMCEGTDYRVDAISMSSSSSSSSDEDVDDPALDEAEREKRRKALVVVLMNRLGRTHAGEGCRFDRVRARKLFLEVLRLSLPSRASTTAWLMVDITYLVRAEEAFRTACAWENPYHAVMRELDEYMPCFWEPAAVAAFPEPEGDTEEQRARGLEWELYATGERQWLTTAKKPSYAISSSSSTTSSGSSSSDESSTVTTISSLSSSSSAEDELMQLQKKKQSEKIKKKSLAAKKAHKPRS